MYFFRGVRWIEWVVGCFISSCVRVTRDLQVADPAGEWPTFRSCCARRWTHKMFHFIGMGEWVRGFGWMGGAMRMTTTVRMTDWLTDYDCVKRVPTWDQISLSSVRDGHQNRGWKRERKRKSVCLWVGRRRSKNNLCRDVVHHLRSNHKKTQEIRKQEKKGKREDPSWSWPSLRI